MSKTKHTNQLSSPMAIGSVALLVAVIAQSKAWPVTPVSAFANSLVAVSLCVIGAIFRSQTRLRPLALGCISGGLLWAVQWITTWNISVLPFIGINTTTWFYAVVGLGVLRSPVDLALTKLDKSVSILLIGFGFMQIAAYFTSEPHWWGFADNIWWPSRFADRTAFDGIAIFLDSLGIIASLLFCVAVIGRLHRMKTTDRIVLLPVSGSVIFVGLSAAIIGVFQPAPSVNQTTLLGLITLLTMALPLGLVATVATRVANRLQATQTINARLGNLNVTASALRDEIREALGDSSVELMFFSQNMGCYVGVDGEPSNPANAISDLRARFDILDSNGMPLATVVGPASLRDDEVLVYSVLNACRTSLSMMHLDSQLKSQLDEIKSLRSSSAVSAIDERIRISRDLHDGAQQRLLALQLRIAATRPGVHEEDELYSYIREEIRECLREIRELAHGIHPPELTQHGILVAMQSVVERLPIRVELNIAEERWAPQIEVAIYFVIREALTNVVKHSNATCAVVQVAGTDASVNIEISDDGNGASEFSVGFGIQSMTDRVRALDGRLTALRSSDGGTQVRAIIPLDDVALSASQSPGLIQ